MEALSKDEKLVLTLDRLDAWVRQEELTDLARVQWGSYRSALAGNVFSRCCALVSSFRVSGYRRHDLRKTIKDGNTILSWPQTILGVLGDEPPENLRTGGVLPEVQLLRDCETRWSSTFSR